MNILVLGSGAREHALAWKLSCSPKVRKVAVCPGNDGMGDFELWDLSLKPHYFIEIAERAKKEKIDLIVVGPDAPLADGIVDFLSEKGFRVFGPTQKAAQIESSKEFSKKIMKAAGVLTAEYRTCKNSSEVERFLTEMKWEKAVVKADGLALGKGVKVCLTPQAVFAAAEELFKSSEKLIVEEFLGGQEISWLALCDGKSAALFPPARDYKRLKSGDFGPNTGGMGAYCPVPEWDDPFLYSRVQQEVFTPILSELARQGCAFVGVLYAGLMVEGSSPKTATIRVLEFNARFGDPEAQVLLPHMQGDLLEWIHAALEARFPANKIPMRPGFSVYVVGASAGYPDQPQIGIEVKKFPKPPAGFVAGLKRAGSLGYVTSGGRVLGALGQTLDLSGARAQAYERLNEFSFEGMQLREDVAQ